MLGVDGMSEVDVDGVDVPPSTVWLVTNPGGGCKPNFGILSSREAEAEAEDVRRLPSSPPNPEALSPSCSLHKVSIQGNYELDE